MTEFYPMRNYKSDHEKLSHLAKGLHFQGGKDTCVEGIILGRVKVSQVVRRKEEAKMQRKKMMKETGLNTRQKEIVPRLPQWLGRPGLHNSGPGFYGIQGQICVFSFIFKCTT